MPRGKAYEGGCRCRAGTGWEREGIYRRDRRDRHVPQSGDGLNGYGRGEAAERRSDEEGD